MATPLISQALGPIMAAIVDGHAHISVMFALDVISIILIFHFLGRAWSGLYPNSPAARGASFVI